MAVRGGKPDTRLSVSGTVAQQDLRSDACIGLRTDVSPPPGIPEAYACSHRGLRREEATTGAIYRNTPLDTPPAELLTDLCLPLRATPKVYGADPTSAPQPLVF